MFPDIYFEDEFGKLYETIEGGKIFNYKLDTSNGKIINNFILRDIPDHEHLKDIITPYGYGGPLIVELRGDKEALLKEYEEDFRKFTKDNNIISEFIRFHPLVRNQKDFETIYEPECIRRTVRTKVSKGETYNKQFSKSTRKKINKLLKEGFSYEIVDRPDNLDKFLNVYYSTMDRKKATEFYYFETDYFLSLLQNFKDNIVLIEIYDIRANLVASGLYLQYKGYLHAHLSGTKTEYINYSPAYLTKLAAVEWAENNGIDYIFHGGGATSDENDGVYLFKKKFAKETLDAEFFVGRKIWNKEIYRKLSEGETKEEKFFPLYRNR